MQEKLEKEQYLALSLNKIDWFRSLIYPKEQIVKFVKSAFFDHFSSGPSKLGPLEPGGKMQFPFPPPFFPLLKLGY